MRRWAVRHHARLGPSTTHDDFTPGVLRTHRRPPHPWTGAPVDGGPVEHVPGGPPDGQHRPSGSARRLGTRGQRIPEPEAPP
jgi:hypothetical protein